MKSYYILGGFAAYIISYLILFSIYKKFNLEKLISGKTRIRISLFLIAILYGSVASFITDSLNITRDFRYLINGFFVIGPTTALIVFALPVNNNKTKL